MSRKNEGAYPDPRGASLLDLRLPTFAQNESKYQIICRKKVKSGMLRISRQQEGIWMQTDAGIRQRRVVMVLQQSQKNA